MAGKRIIPNYRFHKATGKAIVTYYAGSHRKSVLLPGLFNSPESRREYKRIIDIIKAGANPEPEPEPSAPSLTVAELILAFMENRVLPYYRDTDGQPTGEHENFCHSLKPLRHMFGELPAADLKPLDLVAVQQAMIDGSWMPPEEKAEAGGTKSRLPLARSTVNARVGRIKHMYRWASEMQIVPASVYHGLRSVSNLARGRSTARETEDVQPVPVATINATLPHLPPVVRDIVEMLLLTGMRVGEAVIMRAIDIDMTGAVWLYRPVKHKNKWRGKKRVIAIGPKGQAIVRQYLKTKMDAYLFSPREQQAIIDERKRANRKSKVPPSQLCRKKKNPKRAKGELFTPDDINTAIRRACERADIPVWNTHRIRHTTSREISRQHGLEAARALLGHHSLQMTADYAGHDEETAAVVAAKIG